jgi:predicted O-linked N-acetylglucosamine transferase (SPINDLY family)
LANVIEIIQNAYATLRSGRSQQAIEELQRSLRLHQDNPDLHEHLGLIYSQIGQAEQALYHLQRATVFAPQHVDFHVNLATFLNFQGKTTESVESFKRALMFNPASFAAQLGLSSALFGLKQYDGAIEAAKQAAQLEPRTPEPWVNLGLALTRAGRTGEGVKAFRDGIERTGEHALLLMNLAMAMSYRPESTPQEVLDVHDRLGRALAAGGGPTALMPDMNPDRVLRVGYLCPDFPDKAVAWFLKPILAAHDRAKFEVTCYCTRPPSEPEFAGMSTMARWIQAGQMFDPMLADTVRRDGIDILVCLCGHGPMSRLPMLARRVTPVQIAYLGSPATTGIRAIGGRVVDSITDGPEALSVEKLVRLDGCSMAYAPPEDAPDVSTRNGDVVFGCFGAAQKITEPVAEAWAAILRQVPGSSLLLKSGAFDAPITSGNYLKMLVNAGVPADRVTLEGATQGVREHLAAYGRVDVALDTFPYNGMATTCEALWMGVPVVSLTGAMHAGRTGKSLLTAAGLSEWCAESPEGYVKTAVALGKDAKKRAELRASLRERIKGSPLCDGARVTRQLEETYRRLWREWCGNVFYPAPPGGLAPDVP